MCSLSHSGAHLLRDESTIYAEARDILSKTSGRTLNYKRIKRHKSGIWVVVASHSEGISDIQLSDDLFTALPQKDSSSQTASKIHYYFHSRKKTLG